jgi:hypothetical protein
LVDEEQKYGTSKPGRKFGPISFPVVGPEAK